MIRLNELKPYKGSVKRRKVVGRGLGSSHGTFSGRGAKGQKARSGGNIPVGFEGGRMPLHRQIPKKRGFKSLKPKAQVITFAQIEKAFNANQTVNPKELANRGLIKDKQVAVKILIGGEIKKALNYENVIFSAKARALAEKAGGKFLENKK
jgi:large subunit ribosomal protein L15